MPPIISRRFIVALNRAVASAVVCTGLAGKKGPLLPATGSLAEKGDDETFLLFGFVGGRLARVSRGVESPKVHPPGESPRRSLAEARPRPAQRRPFRMAIVTCYS